VARAPGEKVTIATGRPPGAHRDDATFNCSCFNLGKPLSTFALEAGATVDLLI
jgi:hypothetical protein